MLFNDQKDSALNQMEDEDKSQQSEKTVQFLSSVWRLASLLDSNLTGGRSLDETKNTWNRWQIDSLIRQYSHVFDANLPWWMYFRNPWWTCVFNLKRRQFLKAPGDVRVETLRLLDYYLGRAEFGGALSVNAKNLMRRKIADRTLSSWRAMSLLRSFGCKTSKTGDISPAPIGKIGLAIGQTTALSMIATLLLVISVLAGELSGTCVRACVVAGSIQLMTATTYFAMLALSVSSGRNRDAKLLALIQRS